MFSNKRVEQLERQLEWLDKRLDDSKQERRELEAKLELLMSHIGVKIEKVYTHYQVVKK